MMNIIGDDLLRLHEYKAYQYFFNRTGNPTKLVKPDSKKLDKLLYDHNYTFGILNKETMKSNHNNFEYRIISKRIFDELSLPLVQESIRRSNNIKKNVTTNVLGVNLSFSDLFQKIRSEADSSIRKQIFEKACEYLDENINPLYIKYYKNINTLSKMYSFNNYLDLTLTSKNIKVSNIEKLCIEVLEITKFEYFDLLSQVAGKHLRKGIDELNSYDFPLIWKVKSEISKISTKKLIGVFNMLFERINLLREDYLHLNINESPGKSFCYPVSIPEKIYIEVSLRGREDDNRILFHELGHALHLSNIDKNINGFKKNWGDESVKEGFAFLFESILKSPYFLKKYLNIIDKDYIDIFNLYNLYLMRQYASNVLWEINDFKVENMNISRKKWESRIKDATGVLHNGAFCMSQKGYYMSNLNYLRGMYLEKKLNEYMVNQFGNNWFELNSTGEFFSGIWRNSKHLESCEAVLEIIQ